MKKWFNAIDSSLTYLTSKIILAYQHTLSPDTGILSPWLSWTVCSHTPHCSKYAQECLGRYWFFSSISMITERVLSCWPSNTMNYDPSMYRVVFASWAAIWKSFLKWLVEDPRFEVVGVLTMPDAQSGRWMKMKQNVIAEYAYELWIDASDVQKPQSLRTSSKKRWDQAIQTTKRLTDKKIDFLVVVAYGKILPKSVLDIPHFGPINVHGSILPEYRGASPLQSVFLDGKTSSGVTIMYMDEWVDTWDSIDVLKTTIPLSWTVNDLIRRIETKTQDFLCNTLWEFGKWRIDRTPQNESQATHTSKILKEDGLIQLDDSLIAVYRKYQAYALWPKVHFDYQWTTVILEELTIDEESIQQYGNDSWCSAISQLLLNPAIQSCTVKPSWKKSMSRDSFIHWYRNSQ